MAEGIETEAGFTVTFEVGWGDCLLGCIDRHGWTFAVTRDGAATLVDDRAPRFRPGCPAATSAKVGVEAGGPAAGSSPGAPASRVGRSPGRLAPVVKLNDRSCEDRPLAGVTIVVLTRTGIEAGRTTTDASGAFAFSLPPGEYRARAAGGRRAAARRRADPGGRR